MRPIIVNKAELLERVTKNRGLHRTIFLEAVEGYKKEAELQLKNRLRNIQEAKLPKSISIMLSVPSDHTRDYDNAIDMIKMSVGDTIEIDEQGFNQFVRDDWSWKQAWVNVSNSYSSTSRTTYGEEEEEE